MIRIKNIEAPTAELIEKIPNEYRREKTWWWLKDKGESESHAADVSHNGEVGRHGFHMGSTNHGVRLVFEIESNENLAIGERLLIEGKNDKKIGMVYVGDNKALTDIVCYAPYNKEVIPGYKNSNLESIVNNYKAKLKDRELVKEVKEMTLTEKLRKAEETLIACGHKEYANVFRDVYKNLDINREMIEDVKEFFRPRIDENGIER